MADNNNFNSLINEFDDSVPLKAAFNSDDLSNVAKSVNSQNKHEVDAAKAVVPEKVQALVRIINKVVNKFNANLKSKGLKPFSIEKNLTYNAYGATGKVELIEDGNSSHISLNIKKLSKLPALEVISIVSKALTEVVAKENNKENDEEFLNELFDGSAENNIDANGNKVSENAQKVKAIIAAYLKNYLPAVFSDEFKGFKHISEYVANLIVSEMSEQSLEEMLSPFFAFSEEEIQELANSKVERFLETHSSGGLHKARIARVIGKAEYFAEDLTKEIVSIGYEQQAQALLGADVSDPSYKNLKSQFEVVRGEKCLTSQAVKDFCEQYVQNFLHAHNAKSIVVTFEPKGELGSFLDYGGAKQEININLEKLRSMGSFTELAMTLSHELTHAVDASRNKAKGMANEDGTGLLNDIDELDKKELIELGIKDDALELLTSVQKYCYSVNPNERNARIGELSALLFMQKAGSQDPAIQRDISKSIERYIAYQNKTKDRVNGLSNAIAEFESKKEALISAGIIKKNSRACKMIEERIDYLAQRKGLELSTEREDNSIEVAKSIRQQIEKKQVEEKAKKEAELKALEEAELEGYQQGL